MKKIAFVLLLILYVSAPSAPAYFYAGAVQAVSALRDTKEPAETAVPAGKSQSSGKSSVNANPAIAIVFLVLIVLRGWRVSSRYQRRYAVNRKPYMRRPRVRTQVRRDDGEIPSGFGGLGSINDVIRADGGKKDGEGSLEPVDDD